MITRGWQLSARGELSALVTAAASTPWTLFLRDEAFDPTAPHPTPVVLIHGLFGSASNFLSLRRVLAARGVSNVHSFSYLPGIDVSRVAHRLGATIEAICAATRSAHVDVVGHSLGGLVARYLTELPAGHLVRRLVTLGAPYFTTRIAPQELAIFAAHDALIPPPHPDHDALRRSHPGRPRLRAPGPPLPSRRPSSRGAPPGAARETHGRTRARGSAPACRRATGPRPPRDRIAQPRTFPRLHCRSRRSPCGQMVMERTGSWPSAVVGGRLDHLEHAAHRLGALPELDEMSELGERVVIPDAADAGHRQGPGERVTEALESLGVALEIACQHGKVVHAAGQLAVDRRRAVAWRNELDLHPARVAERERKVGAGGSASIAHVLDRDAVETKEGPGVKDRDPMRDGGGEIIDDVRNLLDDSMLDGHETRASAGAHALQLARSEGLVHDDAADRLAGVHQVEGAG